jgi:hypothetical protein
LNAIRIFRPSAWLLCLALGLHFFQTWRCFGSWAAIFDDRPIIQVDHALHLYHGSIGARFVRTAGADWGYDPYFMAGYPKTPFHDPSSGLAELSQLAASLVGAGPYSPSAYKIMVFLTVATTPLLWVWGCRLMKTPPLATAAGVTLAEWYYWADFPNALLGSGLVSFLWACGWQFVLLGLAASSFQDRIRTWILGACVASFAFFVHPTVPILVAAPVLVSLCAAIRRRQWMSLGRIAAAVATALAVNLFWIVPLFYLLPYRRQGYVFLAAPANDPWFFIDFYKASILYQPATVVVALLGMVGLVWRPRGVHGLTRATLGASVLLLFALTFFGSLDASGGLRNVEPLRFQAPLHFILAIAGGATIDRIFSLRGWRLLVGATLIAAVLAGGWRFGVFRGIARQFEQVIHPRPFAIGLAPEVEELCRWLKERTDDSARILFEDQLRVLESTVPESLHWSPLLPILTGRTFVGGQYNETPLQHHYAAFGDFTLGGRRIDRWSGGDLQAFFERYNIGWIVCWSPASTAVFNSLTALAPEGEIARHTSRPTERKYHLYSVRRTHSFMERGRGGIEGADLNRISVRKLEPADGLAVLRFHWLPTLAAVPAVGLEPVQVGADPVPFIGVRTDHPIERLTIYNSYKWKPIADQRGDFGRAKAP